MDKRANAPTNTSQHANPAAKTAVISPGTANAGAPEEPKTSVVKGLFDGLSVSQVAAGALAAVTSMLLSAQIGIAGSVIGVAVGSVVSTVSSQLYKKFLAGSAEKIRGLASNDSADENDDAANESNATTHVHAASTAETTVMPIASSVTAEAAATRVMPNAPQTRNAGQITTAIGRQGAAAGIESSNTPHINSAADRTGNASHATGVIEIETHKRRTTQRRVLAVSVASSIAAILLFAGLVSLFTGGEGLGTKVVPFTGETVTSPLTEEEEAPQADARSTAAAGQTQSQSPSAEATSQGQGQTSNAATENSAGQNEGNSSNADSETGSTNASSNAGSNSSANSGSSSESSTANGGNSSSSNASGNDSSTGTSTNGSGSTNSGSSSSNSNSTAQTGSSSTSGSTTNPSN